MKLFKKVILLILLMIPINVFALSYELDSPMHGETGKGITFIHIKVKEVEQTTKTDKLTCVVSSENATCIIEPLAGYKISDGSILKDDSAETQLLENDKSVGRIVITNSSESEVTTEVTLIYSSKNEDGEESHGSIKREGVTVPGIKPPQSSDSTLKTLTFTSTGDPKIFPEFNSDVYDYTIYGLADTAVKVKFTWNCDECSVKFEGGTHSDSNSIEIKGNNTNFDGKVIVTSQDGNNTSTYYLSIIKGTTAFNSDKIKSIKLDDYEITPAIADDVNEYEVTVPKKITNIEKTLKVETLDPKATVTVEGANKLDNDENKVKITVKAQDGKTNEYTLTVKKEDTTEEIIEVIYYKDKVVAFMNAENTREELSIDKFKENYTNEYKKIEDGTYKFDDEGNIIKNQVVDEPTQEDEKTEEKEEESSFPWLIVILIAVAIIIIIVAGIIIFKEPKKKEEDEEVVPTKEEKENLNDIDTYNEEARLIAENNVIEKENNTPVEETTDEDLNDTVQNNVVEPEETVVKEETIDDYKEDNSPTNDIDAALSDLMNTQEYNFKDK